MGGGAEQGRGRHVEASETAHADPYDDGEATEGGSSGGTPLDRLDGALDGLNGPILGVFNFFGLTEADTKPHL